MTSMRGYWQMPTVEVKINISLHFQGSAAIRFVSLSFKLIFFILTVKEKSVIDFLVITNNLECSKLCSV